MKLEIYDDPTPEANPPVRLRLKKCLDGIEVVVVNIYGETVTAGHLLRFTKAGTVFRHHGVAPGIGFALSEGNQIKFQ